jgi:hypothetical protein
VVCKLENVIIFTDFEEDSWVGDLKGLKIMTSFFQRPASRQSQAQLWLGFVLHTAIKIHSNGRQTEVNGHFYFTLK